MSAQLFTAETVTKVLC